jgi:hypothetical protein
VLLNFKVLDTTKVGLMKKMRTASLAIVKKYTTENPKLEFKIGFHAVPSMRQIHLHVIRYARSSCAFVDLLICLVKTLTQNL